MSGIPNFDKYYKSDNKNCIYNDGNIGSISEMIIEEDISAGDDLSLSSFKQKNEINNNSQK